MEEILDKDKTKIKTWKPPPFLLWNAQKSSCHWHRDDTNVLDSIWEKGESYIFHILYCSPFEIILAILTAKFNSIGLMGQSVCLILSFKTKKSRLASFFPFSLSSVQLLSHIRLFATPWTAVCQASLSITNSWSPSRLMSIESVMPSNHLILCHPLLVLPLIFLSITVFSNESVLRIR